MATAVVVDAGHGVENTEFIHSVTAPLLKSATVKNFDLPLMITTVPDPVIGMMTVYTLLSQGST